MKCHKVDLYRGVCDLHSSQVRADLFSTVPVEEVWGSAGRRLPSSPRLESRRPAPSPPSTRTMRGR